MLSILSEATTKAQQGRDQFMATTMILCVVLWWVWAKYGKRPRDKK